MYKASKLFEAQKHRKSLRDLEGVWLDVHDWAESLLHYG